MNGVLFMIRILLILIILTSCGNLPITYIQNFSSVNNVVFGFPDYKITQEIFDEYEFSFIKVRFGRGPHSILVLAYINEDIFEWHNFNVTQYDVLKTNKILEEINVADQNYIKLKNRDYMNPRFFSSSDHQHIVDPDTKMKTI